MSTETIGNEVTEASESQATPKTYSQKDVDDMMAGLKTSMAKKYEKKFDGIDVDEYRSLKAQAEKAQTEQAMKRGEFEKLLQDMATKKDAEIAKRDDMIRNFKIDMPVLNAAAKFKAVNPEQVKQLIRNNIRLNDEGDVEVLGDNGQVRYDDSGKPVNVDLFVQEWLQKNPHFSQAAPATTNTQSNLGVGATAKTFDLSKLDLTKAEDRKIYAEARRKGQI